MASRRPKIAANVLQRNRIAAWLHYHASTAVRYLCAPAGSGKTTAVVLYARSHSAPVVYLTLEPSTDEAALLAALAGELALPESAGYADIVDRLALSAPLEIVVDNVDFAAADARALLGRIFRDVSDGVTFIYVARAENAVALRQARTQGLVDVCDPALFAFDADEIARFAEVLGLNEDARNIAQLHEETHGWAAAVSGVCRTAAGNARNLPDALRDWRRRNRTLIEELVADALSAVEPQMAAAFNDVLDGRSGADSERLEAFRRHGLFVGEWNGRAALNPLLRLVAGGDGARAPERQTPSAVLEMFGRFEMSIEGKPVAWIRRRDRQIVQYLAMQPDGRATRSQIITAFWPDADRQLAGQSLRSACSTIRRALAACVGRSNVGRYFAGDHVLELVLENALISAHRFAQQIEFAQAAYTRGDLALAYAFYRAAELLYRAPFLAGEPPAAWTGSYDHSYAAMYRVVSQRLDALGAAMYPRSAQRTTLESVSA